MELDYDVDYGAGMVGGPSSGVMALLPPRVNVSARGEVPVTLQVFRIRLPCSGVVSAEIPLALRLNVTAPPGTRYNDTVLVFKRNKICLKGTWIYLVRGIIFRRFCVTILKNVEIHHVSLFSYFPKVNYWKYYWLKQWQNFKDQRIFYWFLAIFLDFKTLIFCSYFIFHWLWQWDCTEKLASTTN